MNYIPKKNTWLQILFWGSLWVAIPLLLSGDHEDVARFLVRGAVVMAGISVVIWLNNEVLMPKLYFQDKLWRYLVAAVALIAGVVFLVETDLAPWAEYFQRPAAMRPKEMPHGGSASPWRTIKLIGSAMPYFTAFIGSALFEISSYARQKEKEAAVSKSEKLETEMKFLKSQFNPHFLFNALNNIYTLTVIQSEKAPDNLLKLSGMLRYVLYDCKADTVPLKKEIEYLRHLIDLNLLKDSRGLNVEVALDESRPNLMIAPMLFIPFVENAFKHSRIEDLNNGWIKIKLTTGDDFVYFEVKNSLPKERFTKDKAGGIGLKNVRRQLELLYPDRHELVIGQDENEFDVSLKIKLT